MLEESLVFQCWTQLDPVSLSADEPQNTAGDYSMKTCVRTGRKKYATGRRDRNDINRGRNKVTKVRHGEERGDAHVCRAEIPLQPVEEDDICSPSRTIPEQATSSNHREDLTQEQVFWRELVCGGPVEEESFTESLCTPGRTCIGGEMSLRKGVVQGGVFFNLSLSLTTLLLTFSHVESVLPIIIIDK